MNQINMNKSRKAIVVLLVAILVAGCAGKRAAKAEAESAQSGSQKTMPQDMTRPPTTIGAERKIVVESNPDETISFEEWKRRQAVDAEDRGDAAVGEPE